MSTLLVTLVGASGCSEPIAAGGEENVHVQNNTPSSVKFDILIVDASTGAVAFGNEVEVPPWHGSSIATLPDGWYDVSVFTANGSAQRYVQIAPENRILISQGQNVGLEINVVWRDGF